MQHFALGRTDEIMSFCTNCGRPLNSTDTFCSSCGEHVKPSKEAGSERPNYQSNQTPPSSQYSQSSFSYPPPKQFYRSPDNKIIAGVCGGLSEYFNIDPVLVRVGFVLFAIVGPGLIAYIILALLVQERPRS